MVKVVDHGFPPWERRRGSDGTKPAHFAYCKEEAENAVCGGFARVCVNQPAYIYPAEPPKEPNFDYGLLRAVSLYSECCFRIPTDGLAIVKVAARRPSGGGAEVGNWRPPCGLAHRDVAASTTPVISSSRALLPLR
jgi:hypothetical protein